jgi:hypothetical protein
MKIIKEMSQGGGTSRGDSSIHAVREGDFT